MTDQKLLERIIVNPKVMTGKPVIRGTRLTVEFILNLMAHDATIQEIIGEYKDLTSRIFKRVFSLPAKGSSKNNFPILDFSRPRSSD